jgi:hypothetical protein
MINYFIKYSSVFLGGDPTKKDKDHKSRSAVVGRDKVDRGKRFWMRVDLTALFEITANSPPLSNKSSPSPL